MSASTAGRSLEVRALRTRPRSHPSRCPTSLPHCSARRATPLLRPRHSELPARVCRRVLARLTRDRLLARLDRRVGGVRAGSASYVYALGSEGGQLLAGTRYRVTEPSSLFLDHTLAIADARIELEAAARERLFDLVEVEIEPS